MGSGLVEGRLSSSQESVEHVGGRLTRLFVALVVDPSGIHPVAARPNQPSLAQPRQVVRHVVLALAKRRRHLAHAMRTFGEDAQDAGARPVADQCRRSDSVIHVRRRQIEAEFWENRQLAISDGHLSE